MGYYSTFSGGFKYLAPISEEVQAEIKAIDEESYDTLDVGLYDLNVKYYSDSMKWYGIFKDFTAIQAILQKNGNGLGEGHILVQGEEGGDIWRLIVKDGQIDEEKAIFTWPDGSKIVGLVR